MRILGWKDLVFVKRNSFLVSRTKRTVLGTLNNGWLKEIHAGRHSERTMHVRGWVAIGKMFTVEKYYCRRGRNSAREWLRVSYSTNKPGNSGDSGVELKLSKMFPYLSRLAYFSEGSILTETSSSVKNISHLQTCCCLFACVGKVTAKYPTFTKELDFIQHVSLNVFCKR